MTGSEAVPPDDERLTRTVVGGVGLTAAGFVLTRLLTFAIYLVLARLAAPEVFGRFAAASILLGAASIFVESGMLSALIQRRDRLEEAADTAFAATMLGGVALTLAALAAAPLIGLVFGSREIRNVAAGLSGVLAIGAATVVPDALLQRRFSILRRVIVDPLGVAAFGLTSIVALHEGLGVWALVLGTYASEVVQVVAAWKASGFRPRRRGVSLEMWRELARYGRYVLAATSIDHVAVAANTVLLGRFVSAGALGQYRYATRLGLVTQDLFVTAGSYALFPAFARVSHDRERFDRGFVKALRWSSWAVVPTSLLLLPLGPPLVVFLLGARWHPAGEALAVLSVAAASASVGSVSAEGLKASARTDALPRLHGIQAVLTIAFMAALLPFGLIGVAVGYTAGTVAANGYALVRAADLLELGRANALRAIWPAWAASVPMVAGLFALDRFVVHAAGHRVLPGLALLLLEAIAGLALYAAWLQVFAPEAGSGLKRLVCAISSRARRQPLPAPGTRRPVRVTRATLAEPIFSVVMPAHDSAKTIGAAIESALCQTCAELEIIVVDDGSADDTAGEVERFASDPRVRLVRQARAGPGGARNIAFALARGRFASMLDSDDLWLPTYLEVVAETFERHPAADLAFTGAWALDEPPGLIRRAPLGEPPNGRNAFGGRELLEQLLARNFLVNSAVTVRRSALDGVGGCDPALPAAVDLDLWLRIAAAGHGAVRAPGRHVVYRAHRGSIQNDPLNELRALRSLREVLERVGDRQDVPNEVQASVIARIASLDTRIRLLSGERPLARAGIRARRGAAPVARALIRSRRWYATPPPEVASVLALNGYERVNGSA